MYHPLNFLEETSSIVHRYRRLKKLSLKLNAGHPRHSQQIFGQYKTNLSFGVLDLDIV
jgi:hypothetical protein